MTLSLPIKRSVIYHRHPILSSNKNVYTVMWSKEQHSDRKNNTMQILVVRKSRRKNGLVITHGLQKNIFIWKSRWLVFLVSPKQWETVFRFRRKESVFAKLDFIMLEEWKMRKQQAFVQPFPGLLIRKFILLGPIWAGLWWEYLILVNLT